MAPQPSPRNSLSRRRMASDSSRSTSGAVRLSPEKNAILVHPRFASARGGARAGQPSTRRTASSPCRTSSAGATSARRK